MVSDKQYWRLMKLLNTGKTLGRAAALSDMDEKTARKYRHLANRRRSFDNRAAIERGRTFSPVFGMNWFRFWKANRKSKRPPCSSICPSGIRTAFPILICGLCSGE